MRIRVIAFFIVVTASLLLIQCELFLGDTTNTNVTIDLGEVWGDSAGRAIQLVPDGTVPTLIRVSVFGEHMTSMVKTVSPGTRYINLYVPAGNDRHFTLECFFSIPGTSPYSQIHMRSFKGRASADLKPGAAVRILFRMVAGATTLLVPDYYNFDQKIHESETLDFSESTGSMFGSIYAPSDLDITADGRIVMSEDYSLVTPPPDFFMGNDITGASSYGIYGPRYAIAMDRDSQHDIDNDDSIDTNIMYLADNFTLSYVILAQSPEYLDLPSVPVDLQPLEPQGRIIGMTVDPWSHHLFIVGDDGYDYATPRIVEYDPFYSDPLFPDNPQGRIVKDVFCNFLGYCSFQDVIVKEDMIFVLNKVNPEDINTPILLKFDRQLNYKGGFGRISSEDQGGGEWILVESTAPGNFYHPIRFFAHENEGLYIMDDSELFDKVIYINTDLTASSWKTFPTNVGDSEPFDFIENNF